MSDEITLVIDPGKDLGLSWHYGDPSFVHVATIYTSDDDPLIRAKRLSLALSQFWTDPTKVTEIIVLDSFGATRGKYALMSQAFSVGVVIGTLGTLGADFSVEMLNEQKARLKVIEGRSKKAVREWADEHVPRSIIINDHELDALVGLVFRTGEVPTNVQKW